MAVLMYGNVQMSQMTKYNNCFYKLDRSYVNIISLSSDIFFCYITMADLVCVGFVMKRETPSVMYFQFSIPT